MFIQKVNIWDLGTKINIKVTKKFLCLINNEIKKQFRTKRAVHKEIIKYYQISFLTFKSRIKPSYKFFIDLEVFLNLCKILKISLDYFQNNIIAYKSRGGVNYIDNPNLPIKISPIFDMLIAHHIGDGTVVNPKRNRKPYFGYRQFDRKYMQLYTKKMESVFGRIQNKNPYKDKTRTYSPTSVSNLFFETYGLSTRNFLSKSARIPNNILKKNSKHLLAFLLGIIIDDGHVDSTEIVIGLHNRNLTKDLQKVCDLLGYKTTYTEKTKEDGSEYGFLHILKNGLLKLWKDYSQLLVQYPEIDLGYKAEQIQQGLEISKRKIKRTPGNDKVILDLFATKSCTVNEIAKEIKMTRQGVRYHITKLLEQGKIKHVGTAGENNFVYATI